jgi:PAS domain S-box-containing protein
VALNTKDNLSIYLHLTGIASADNEKFFITAVDISERKQAEEELKKSEQAKSELSEKLNEAQHIAMIGSWEWDLQTNKVWWSDETYLIFGVSSLDYTPGFDTNGKFIHPDDLDKYQKSFEHSLQTNEPLDAEIRLNSGDGMLKYCQAKGKIISDIKGKKLRFVGTIMDITERKKAEAELHEKEIQYRNLANSGLSLIWTSGTDKLCNYFNEPWLNFTGRSLEQEMGNGWAEGVHPDDFDQCLNTYVTAFDKREAFEMEYRLRHVSGEYRWILDLGTPNYNSKGEFLGYIGNCFDITERKQSEQELLAAKQNAEESDHLKTSFLANMSHEIRTPMNSIMGFASLLPEEESKELIANYANIIVQNSEQLVHIIDDIVLYSRLQTGLLTCKPNSFDAQKLLSDVKQSFNLPEFRKAVDLKIETEEAFIINSDYDKLRQIFTNLVSNAFKYTCKDVITIGFSKKAGEIVFYVKDTGIGIPHNELEKVFGRFYRGSNVNKGAIGGTGLGLSIVQELIQLLDGKIWVESEEGKGSIFNFTIPL